MSPPFTLSLWLLERVPAWLTLGLAGVSLGQGFLCSLVSAFVTLSWTSLLPLSPSRSGLGCAKPSGSPTPCLQLWTVDRSHLTLHRLHGVPSSLLPTNHSSSASLGFTLCLHSGGGRFDTALSHTASIQTSCDPNLNTPWSENSVVSIAVRWPLETQNPLRNASRVQ